MKCCLFLFLTLFFPVYACFAENEPDKTSHGTTDFNTIKAEEITPAPEDYNFNVASVPLEDEAWKKFEFHGFFEVTSPIHGRDDESQQPSSSFLEENEFTFWLGKQITRKLSFDSEVEITKGLQKYALEKCEFDYEILEKKLLVFRAGKFKYPLGIERFVEDGPLNKLIDRPFPSIRIVPGTYSDIGIMLMGTLSFPADTKLKYEIALSNGLEGPEPEDVQQLWDNNSNKAIGGRVGYEFLPGLEIGSSYSRGAYDEGNKRDIDFFGADIQFKRGNLEIRGEYIISNVEQSSAKGGDYQRDGYYLQTSYRYPFNLNYLRYLEGALRFDSVDPNRDITEGNEADRISFGLNYSPIEHLEFKLEYEVENEPGVETHGKSFVQAIFRW